MQVQCQIYTIFSIHVIKRSRFLPMFSFDLGIVFIHAKHLLWANLEDGWASSDGVICHGCVAAGQDDVGLAADWCSAIGCHWDGKSETSVNGSCAVKIVSTWIIPSFRLVELTERRLGQ